MHFEHNNCFREWVVAESEEQAIDFLKRNQFHEEETERGKEWQTDAKLLAVCSDFAQARKLLQKHALSQDIHRYDYLIDTRLLNKLS